MKGRATWNHIVNFTFEATSNLPARLLEQSELGFSVMQRSARWARGSVTHQPQEKREAQ